MSRCVVTALGIACHGSYSASRKRLADCWLVRLSDVTGFPGSFPKHTRLPGKSHSRAVKQVPLVGHSSSFCLHVHPPFSQCARLPASLRIECVQFMLLLLQPAL